MIEYVGGGNRFPVSFWKKINPVWWLMNGESWTAPSFNNDEPYLPGVTNQFLRDWYWWWRNPCANFVGFVIGVEDKTYTVIGPAPVMMTTYADAKPPQRGWKWAILDAPVSAGWALMMFMLIVGTGLMSAWLMLPALFALVLTGGILPFVSYAGPVVFYLGWRPESGGFGFKLVKGK